MTAVAVSNCVDENQTSFISPSHSLPPSPLTLHSLFVCLSLSLSLSLRPKIMRSLPSQGPFHIKTLSSLSFSVTLTLSLSLSTSCLPRDRPAPRHSHIRACRVSITPPHAHTKRFLSDPICLIVKEKGKLNSFDLSQCVHCTLPCVYIYLCLCKNVLAYTFC